MYNIDENIRNESNLSVKYLDPISKTNKFKVFGCDSAKKIYFWIT